MVEFISPLNPKYMDRYDHDPDIHCPSCGEARVWVEHGGGDYYQGPAHVCIGCDTRFTLPSFLKDTDGYAARIREALAKGE